VGLFAALDDPNETVMRGALKQLREESQADPSFWKSEQALPLKQRIVGLLENSDSLLQTDAAALLGSMGEAGRELAPRLVRLLGDRNGWVELHMAGALVRMGEPAAARSTLARMLESPDAYLRERTAQLLGDLGEAGREHAPQLARLLKDPNADVQRVAADSLVRMGEAARVQDFLGRLLEDPESHIRAKAAEMLGKAGAASRKHAPRLARLLDDADMEVRLAAVRALGQLGVAAREQTPRVSRLLKDPDFEVQLTAAEALARMGEATLAQEFLVGLLKDPDSLFEVSISETLKRLGEHSPEQHSFLVRLLEDPHPEVRQGAVEALGKMGAAAREQVPRLVQLLEDTDPRVRQAAALSLGEMGTVAREQAPQLVKLLEDTDSTVQRAAVAALARMGAARQEQAPILVKELKGSSLHLGSGEAATILSRMAPLELQHLAAIIAKTSSDSGNRTTWLLHAHAAGGGRPEVERILRWLGRTSEELPQQLSHPEARATLEAFAALWPWTEEYPTLRDELAGRISHVAELSRSQWRSADRALLALHQRELSKTHPLHAKMVQGVIARGDTRRPLENIGWAWAAHAGFWVLLLVFYPRSPKVQALFFWNPWVRRLAGLGYVSLLLTWVPPLRRRLLAPFREVLLADADLEHFSPENYFSRCEVLTPPDGRRERLVRALPRLQGQVVLVGASGLGKSMFLKYLVQRTKRLAVYLPAERCKGGVIEAIQAKLQGTAGDTTFLRSIIYSGALDIYIDGLNEVTADTRARIVQFVEHNFHGNILLTTQPIDWTAPTTARSYELLPLTEQQIADFLASREPTLSRDSRLRGTAYVEAGGRFVRQALSSVEDAEQRRSVLEVLSNPLDLTVVAQMLADEHTPDMFHLPQQQYALMAEDYRRKSLAPFPLREFAEEAYQLRCQDRADIPEERFGRELQHMEKARFKMVVRREWQQPDGTPRREWRFRHDKIQEFFIAQTFLGEDHARLREHLGDARFRGVYFLLALLLAPEDAQELRDRLVEHAAQTRDHTVSDDFVNLLRARAHRPPETRFTPELLQA
jgi:HEAT repeat protein